MKKMIGIVTILVATAFGQSMDSREGDLLASVNGSLSNERSGVYREKLDSVLDFEYGVNAKPWKTLCTYDSMGNLISDTIFSQINGYWVYGDWNSSNYPSVNTYVYDVNGNLIENRSFYRSGQSVYEKQKRAFEYDVNGRMVTKKVYRFGFQWDLESTTRYSYDESGNLIQEMKEGWNLTTDRYEITYDEHKREISQMYSTLSGIEWKNHRRKISTYDNQGYLAEKREQFYNDTGWENQLLIVYSYDSFGNNIGQIRTSDNKTFRKNGRSFDAIGNIISDTTSVKTGDGKWNVLSVNKNSYEPATPISSIAYGGSAKLSFGTLGCKSKLLKEVTERSKTYFYSPFNQTDIQFNKFTPKFNLVFNYASKTLSLSQSVPAGSSVSLYDLSGRVVYSSAVIGSTTPVFSLAKGIYIAEILTGKSSVVQKIRIE